MECTRLKLINRENPAIDNAQVKLTEIKDFTVINTTNTNKILLKNNNDYGYTLLAGFFVVSTCLTFSLETICPYDTHGGTIKLEVVSNKESLVLDQQEFDDPHEYGDLYTPYKYGTLFKERIYVRLISKFKI